MFNRWAIPYNLIKALQRMGSHSKTTNRPDNGGHTDQRRPQRQPGGHTDQRRPHRSTVNHRQNNGGHHRSTP
ncbi:hypothetical protein PGT21_000126 [Puccinia graminis f. sp. tritici]|uniref:Uncharacterized protein n=1 Tax=Puccinia graminis f. sp. tritici TaxID=56615 RepID=A0A5B0LSH5_PUCGR|nr:hypothetical protein PGT21_000126 [Puccinia graminis f. sp. tritici]